MASGTDGATAAGTVSRQPKLARPATKDPLESLVAVAG